MAHINTLKQRCSYLISQIKESQGVAERQQNEYKVEAANAYTAIQEAMTTHGLQTIDQLLQLCIKQCPKEEVERFLEILKKFDKAPKNQPFQYQVKDFLCSMIGIDPDLVQPNRQLTSDELWNAMGNVVFQVFLNGWVLDMLVDSEETLDAVGTKLAENAYPDTLLGFISGLTLLGLAKYESYKHEADRQKLKSTLIAVCSSRLYAQLSIKLLYAMTDIMVLTRQLVAAINTGDPILQAFALKGLLEGRDVNAKGITMQSVYNSLKAQDGDVARDDPPLADQYLMRVRRGVWARTMISSLSTVVDKRRHVFHSNM